MKTPKTASLCLDFSEIPPAIGPSSDLDAFEKFVKQFLEVVHGAIVIKTVGRGPDRGADLIVQVKGELWLINCKHYRSRAVPMSELGEPRATLDDHGCDRYVCIFSNTPSDPLVARLVSIKKNHRDFEYFVWSDRDIEAQLLSCQNAEGWILAARWFPKSYGRIFSRLAYPVQQFSESDVHVNEVLCRTLIPGIPLERVFSRRHVESRDEAIRSTVQDANEISTSRAFDRLFVHRIAEFAAVFPGSFSKMRFVPAEEITSGSVFPSWDFDYLARLMLQEPGHRTAVFNICRVWSFWNAQRAGEMLRVLRLLWGMDWEDFDVGPITEHAILAKCAEEDGANEAESAYADVALDQLSIGGTSNWLSTDNRGFFAALLCFNPGGLYETKRGADGHIHLARHLGELPELLTRMEAATVGLSQHDLEYVESHGFQPAALLTSLRAVDNEHKLMSTIEEGLRCFVEPVLEPWVPEEKPDSAVARAFGLCRGTNGRRKTIVVSGY